MRPIFMYPFISIFDVSACVKWLIQCKTQIKWCVCVCVCVCVCLTDDEESLELRLYCGCKTGQQSTEKFLFGISGMIISII